MTGLHNSESQAKLTKALWIREIPFEYTRFLTKWGKWRKPVYPFAFSYQHFSLFVSRGSAAEDSQLPKKMKLARWELGAALEAEKAID